MTTPRYWLNIACALASGCVKPTSLVMNLPRTWFFLPHVPEPEAMESNEEAEAYSSAAAHAHLDLLDNTFVDHVVSQGVRSGVALDVGTGSGQIPIKLALRLP